MTSIKSKYVYLVFSGSFIWARNPIGIPSLNLFDTSNPVYDPAEEEFLLLASDFVDYRRRMQKKKKKRGTRL